jgi:hypothetical protein
MYILFTGCGGSSGSSTNTGDMGNLPNQSMDDTKIKNHSPFNKIKSLANNKKIGVGIYSGNGVKYYKLVMPKKGNIIDDISTVGADLYDNNLNLIENNFASHPVTLEAGTYSLKVRFYEKSNSSIALNSDALYNQNDLPVIETGTTTSNGVKFYKLIMPKKGNIVIDDISTVRATLYDINLNLIENNFSSTPVTLEKGTYILKVRFYENSNSSINLNF